ncbi:class I SAM-dependent methyltransferase [Salinimicrobium oceani]|uniref:Class I SAM-dependent methyltransferase n=1 Tax=Salinimicrobium oceani TaxID=2722702 RepID=A0ABX1CYB8_9FLAO|nr:class I SAM-dependent methyltransferase [Salinimicrobium oceani]NJW53253.1 class I SAM-dependent methyltransferase [Salinimicrobium oceani]
MKDLFSGHSRQYSQYRPGYPAELIQFILQLCKSHDSAWDCATGIGQVAGALAAHVKTVAATDISINQLSQGIQMSNVIYTRQPAERTNFPNEYFDLVTVGQAVHWFDLERFYPEVKRVLKKDAVIALFGYGLFKSNKETNEIIKHFYDIVIGPYWQPERRLLDAAYRSIPFPFKEIKAPEFHFEQRWSLERLIGYLNTWSAVKAYEAEKGENPVEKISKELRRSFGEVGKVNFPILLRVGRNGEIT